jgi:hypothetical protein
MFKNDSTACLSKALNGQARILILTGSDGLLAADGGKLLKQIEILTKVNDMKIDFHCIITPLGKERLLNSECAVP